MVAGFVELPVATNFVDATIVGLETEIAGFSHTAVIGFAGATFDGGTVSSSSESSKKSSSVDFEGMKTGLGAADSEAAGRVGTSSGDERRLITSGMLAISYEQLGAKRTSKCELDIAVANDNLGSGCNVVVSSSFGRVNFASPQHPLPRDAKEAPLLPKRLRVDEGALKGG